MTYRFSLGRPVPESPGRRASTSAITAPSPKDGEVRRTALPDTWDGIRFEIGRMLQYVKDAADDPLMQEHTRRICGQYFEMAQSLAGAEGRSMDDADPASVCLEAIDAWCRDHFAYVNDPPGIEVLQTPRRMMKQTKVPPEVIQSVMSPFYDAMAAVEGPERVKDYRPPPLCWGDCDEGGVLTLGHCACAPVERPALGGGMKGGLGPLQFRFGGHDGTLHHVWSFIRCGDKWYDVDLTEPDYKLGDHSRFEHYEVVEVPL
jgi:hypothetical protein